MATDPRKVLGDAGERLAERHLEARGYHVLERNFRTRYGELDVVARDGPALVFCEVKARRAPTHFGPLTSVGPRKRAQLRRMAGQWLHERGRARGTREVRFDVIGITVDGAGRVLALEHLENAF